MVGFGWDHHMAIKGAINILNKKSYYVKFLKRSTINYEPDIYQTIPLATIKVCGTQDVGGF
jgi:hypothetical protein